MIREFIYLDIDRLKSVLAQIDKGVLDQVVRTKSGSEGSTVSGEASLAGLLKGKGGLSFLLEDSESETRTLHDYIYTLAEEALQKENSLVCLGADDDNSLTRKNIVAKLSSTSIALIEGRVIINDFAAMRSMFEDFNNLTSFIVLCATQDDPSGTGENKKRRVQMEQHFRLDKKMLEGFKLFITKFYNDRIILKMLPYETLPDLRFTGVLKEDYLRDQIDNITYKYGSVPEDNWHMLAQIASIPKSEDLRTPLDTLTGSTIEMAMHKLFDSMREMDELAFCVKYPEIAVTPIAIYRC